MTRDRGGVVGGQMRHDVDGIGGHHQQRLRGVPGDTVDDVAKDGSVAAQQLQAGLALFLVGAGGDDHHLAAGQIGVVAGADREGMGKGDGVQQVVGFGLSPGGVFVHQHNLAPHAAHHQRIRRGGAHQSAANDADPHAGIINLVRHGSAADGAARKF